METNDEERNDHNYFGNPERTSDFRSDVFDKEKHLESIENFFIDRMDIVAESEKQLSDSELNDYDVIEEEIVDNTSSPDFSEDYEEDEKSDGGNSKKDNMDNSSCNSYSKNIPVYNNEENDSKNNVTKIRHVESHAPVDNDKAVYNENYVRKDSGKVSLNELNLCGTEIVNTENCIKTDVCITSKVDLNDENVDKNISSSKELVDSVNEPEVKNEQNTEQCSSASNSKKVFKDSLITSVDVDQCKFSDHLNTDGNSVYEDDASVKSIENSSFNTDFNDEIGDEELDSSDILSSITESDSNGFGESNSSKTLSSQKKARKRQPPIMIGYKKRRKTTHNKKNGEDNWDTSGKSSVKSDINEDFKLSSLDTEYSMKVEDKSNECRKQLEQSSSEENLCDNFSRSTRSLRKNSGSISEIVGADKYCWICHKEGGSMLNCITCPRIFHVKCYLQQCNSNSNNSSNEDTNNFYCPECSAVLKADNVNTRSPVLSTVNLDQLCTLLNHIINILKSQKDSQIFWGPVDTKEFPYYRDYVVYPMDLSVLEKNVKNKIYGCTDAFLADVKWIVHNSIVFNSKAAKITNVAKNLLKICKREIQEIETCAECYYNSLVRKDTWFVEVCKKPHLLVWARLKGYPPWPAKALKCKDEQVDCRFFGAHDKAWVPLKDCFLYSKTPPQPVKVKRGSHLDNGIQELEKHIKKLRDKFGIFVYPESRIQYRPSAELDQLRLMLPNYNPSASDHSMKYLIHPDRTNINIKPKILFTKESPEIAKNKCTEENDDKLSLEKDTSEKLSTNFDSCSDNDSTCSSTNSSLKNNASKEIAATAVATGNEDFVANTDATTEFKLAENKSAQIIANETESDKSTENILSCEQKVKSPSPVISDENNFINNNSCKTKKLVTIKNIESINASVTSARSNIPTRSLVNTCIKKKCVSSIDSAEEKRTKSLDMIRVVKQIANSVPSNKMTKSNVTENSKSCNLLSNSKSTSSNDCSLSDDVNVPNSSNSNSCVDINSSLSSACSSLSPSSYSVKNEENSTSKVSTVDVISDTSPENHFDLNKVKSEPEEKFRCYTIDDDDDGNDNNDNDDDVDDDNDNDDDDINKKEHKINVNTDIMVAESNSSSSNNINNKNKRDNKHINNVDEDSGSIKRSKTEPSLRTVNITENVTISVVNNQNSSATMATSPRNTNINRVKTSQKVHVAARVNNEIPSNTENTNNNNIVSKGKTAPAKPIPILNGQSLIAKIAMAKPINSTSNEAPLMNGFAHTSSSKFSNSVPSARVSPKIHDNVAQSTINNVLDECMTEFECNFRKIFETALEKIAGKGDLRAKVILMKKEIESLKRNQELIVDEIKRDYEIQIAELRATSIAKTQFDLAAERLKFEQEKERAVKEAKSKQWCSNCQKIANYYCCWNTAYCDFECQKDHWIQHMHVCKNDVKKKAAESSENEPPRIMMQNDISNNFLINGYDKSHSTTGAAITNYTYQNNSNSGIEFRNNLVSRLQVKNVNPVKTTPKPILSRTLVVPASSAATVFSSINNASNSINSSTTLQRKYLVNVTSSSSSVTTANFSKANIIHGIQTGSVVSVNRQASQFNK